MICPKICVLPTKVPLVIFRGNKDQKILRWQRIPEDWQRSKKEKKVVNKEFGRLFLLLKATFLIQSQ